MQFRFGYRGDHKVCETYTVRQYCFCNVSPATTNHNMLWFLKPTMRCSTEKESSSCSHRFLRVWDWLDLGCSYLFTSWSCTSVVPRNRSAHRSRLALKIFVIEWVDMGGTTTSLKPPTKRSFIFKGNSGGVFVPPKERETVRHSEQRPIAKYQFIFKNINRIVENTPTQKFVCSLSVFFTF